MGLLNKFLKLLKAGMPIITMLCVIVLFRFTDFFLLKFYPAVVNFGFFVVFFSSIFREHTIIQKFAMASEGGNLKPWVMDYTRKLTYIWSGFMFLNFIAASVTIFLPYKIWAVYNGFISYLLVGSFFVIEYIIRLIFKRKYDC